MHSSLAFISRWLGPLLLVTTACMALLQKQVSLAIWGFGASFILIAWQREAYQRQRLHAEQQSKEQQSVQSALMAYLRALTQGESFDVPDLPDQWQEISRQLRSIHLYLSISQRSLEDRQQLYEEMEDKLSANEHELQRSEIKVLEYTLALQQIHQIQRQMQGQMHMESLVTQTTKLLAQYIRVHQALCLRFKSESAEVIWSYNLPPSHGSVFPLSPLLERMSTQDSQEPVSLLQFHRQQILPNLFAEQAVILPITLEQDYWGALIFIDRQDSSDEQSGRVPFQESDFLILRNIMAFMQQELRSARLFEMATVDSLSQLYMRRYFDSRLQDELRRAKRHPSQFALLVIDIDHFKTVNDSYGHLVGDEVIYLVSARIKAQLRQGLDLAGRYGGEEMVVLLPETTAPNAVLVAERIRQSIAELHIPALSKTREMPHITVSIGVACYPEHGQDARALFETSDQNLYQAKNRGRNQVFISGNAHETPALT